MFSYDIFPISLILAVALLMVYAVFISLRKPLLTRLDIFTLLTLCVLIFLFLAIGLYHFTVDDCYISLRYARNLANGHGLVFSQDENPPIEGYTNFLWVLLEVPLFKMNLSNETITHIVKSIGIFFGIGMVIASYKLATLLSGSTRSGLLTALFLACFPNFSFWAVGGLETTMYIFWLILGLYLYIKERRETKKHIGSIICFVLLSMTRPEGIVLTLAILSYEFFSTIILGVRQKTTRTKEMSSVAFSLLLYVGLYGVYFLWRYNYYGHLFPNTFYAKNSGVGYESLKDRLDGLRYFIYYLLPFVIYVLVRHKKLSKSNHHEKWLLVLVLGVVFASIFAAKREWMPGFRYELPFVAILFVLFAMTVPILQLGDKNVVLGSVNRRSIIRFFVIFLIGLYLLLPASKLAAKSSYTDDLNKEHVQLGKWLKKYAPSGASYAGKDMGAVPYFSELPVAIDTHPEGLLCPNTIRNGYDVKYFLALKPSFMALPHENNPMNIVRKDGQRGFYFEDEFWENYAYLFSFASRGKLHYAIYKRKDIEISQLALNEGMRLANLSLEVN